METEPSAQLTQFIDKFSPANQRLINGVRDALRARLPGAHELVYDNYNFFVIGYCATEKPSDCIVSLAASAKGVSLSFYRGAAISDPDGLLQGSGAQNRFIRLEDPSTLSLPGVIDLINKAISGAPSPLDTGHQGRLIIRSISAKQRPRQ
ncbi:MAG: DUF1801 domain-containing protein [Phenylobacterium sp.]